MRQLLILKHICLLFDDNKIIFVMLDPEQYAACSNSLYRLKIAPPPQILFLTAVKLQANVQALEILGCVVGRIL